MPHPGRFIIRAFSAELVWAGKSRDLTRAKSVTVRPRISFDFRIAELRQTRSSGVGYGGSFLYRRTPADSIVRGGLRGEFSVSQNSGRLDRPGWATGGVFCIAELRQTRSSGVGLRGWQFTNCPNVPQGHAMACCYGNSTNFPCVFPREGDSGAIRESRLPECLNSRAYGLSAYRLPLSPMEIEGVEGEGGDRQHEGDEVGVYLAGLCGEVEFGFGVLDGNRDGCRGAKGT